MFSYKFLGNKLLHLFLVFLGVSIVTFAISHVIPGDPAPVSYTHLTLPTILRV